MNNTKLDILSVTPSDTLNWEDLIVKMYFLESNDYFFFKTRDDRNVARQTILVL